MRIFLRDQAAHLASWLPELRAARLSYQTTGGLPETIFRNRVPTARRDLYACELGFLFRYEIFPPSLLRFFGEWQLEGRDMRAGDTIVQQAHVPPGLGFRLLFGVRMLTVFRDALRAGFSYGTLEGHPETGVNEFSLSVAEGFLTARVRTLAAPGLALSRALGPFFTKPFVAFCNRQALARMVTQVAKYAS